MPLKSVDATGGVVEPKELKFPYNIPCDDPYSDFSKYFSARDQGMISDDVDLASVSAAVPLVSFRNLDDWCYVEEFDKTTFTQVDFSTISVSYYYFLMQIPLVLTLDYDVCGITLSLYPHQQVEKCAWPNASCIFFSVPTQIHSNNKISTCLILDS